MRSRTGPFQADECAIIRANAAAMYEQAHERHGKDAFAYAGRIPTAAEHAGMAPCMAEAYGRLIIAGLEAAESKCVRLYIFHPRPEGPRRIILDRNRALADYTPVDQFITALESIDPNNIQDLKFMKATYKPGISPLVQLMTRNQRMDLLSPIFEPMILETLPDAYPSPEAILTHSLKYMMRKAEGAKLG